MELTQHPYGVVSCLYTFKYVRMSGATHPPDNTENFPRCLNFKGPNVICFSNQDTKDVQAVGALATCIFYEHVL